MKKNKKGFTIVELVIVIAVIGILAAVLIPTFTSVIDNANRSAAQSNIKNASTTLLADQADATLPAGVVIVSGDYYAVVGSDHQVGEVTKGDYITKKTEASYVKAGSIFVTGVTYYSDNTGSTKVDSPQATNIASYFVEVIGTKDSVNYTVYNNNDLSNDVIVYVPAGENA